MRIGIIGDGERAEARRQALAVLPQASFAGTLPSDACEVRSAAASPLDVFLRDLDAVFVAVPTAMHFTAAEAATKQGVHVFLEWPPATSVRECQAIVHLAEEAGVEVGVSRPWRWVEALETWKSARRASLLTLHKEGASPSGAPPAWPQWLADALDVCCVLARSHSIQRVDAEAVRGGGAWPRAVAFGLRFYNGVYAQASIRHAAQECGTLYLAAPGSEQEIALPTAHAPDLLTAETHAFVRSIAASQAAPVSVLEGLHIMRLTERLMAKLR